MKSLLQTLPQEEEIEFWNARVRTNLAALKNTNKMNHPVLGELADLFAAIEAQDDRVVSASVILAGHNFKLTACPEKGSHARAQKTTVKVTRCKMCREWCYPGHEKKKSSHRRGCPMVLALEVMES
jgi:hypothetical protein